MTYNSPSIHAGVSTLPVLTAIRLAPDAQARWEPFQHEDDAVFAWPLLLLLLQLDRAWASLRLVMLLLKLEVGLLWRAILVHLDHPGGAWTSVPR
jgi:hypothetical protein